MERSVLFWDSEARVYFQLWVGLSSALPVQSNPAQVIER